MPMFYSTINVKCERCVFSEAGRCAGSFAGLPLPDAGSSKRICHRTHLGLVSFLFCPLVLVWSSASRCLLASSSDNLFSSRFLAML